MVLKLEQFCLQIFDLFDVKRKGVIDFGDFVRSLNVFHPNAPQEDKIDCKFHRWYITFNCKVYITVAEFYKLYRKLLGCLVLQFHLSSMIWMVRAILSARRSVVSLWLFAVIFACKFRTVLLVCYGRSYCKMRIYVWILAGQANVNCSSLRVWNEVGWRDYWNNTG